MQIFEAPPIPPEREDHYQVEFHLASSNHPGLKDRHANANASFLMSHWLGHFSLKLLKDLQSNSRAFPALILILLDEHRAGDCAFLQEMQHVRKDKGDERLATLRTAIRTTETLDVTCPSATNASQFN